jgi:hypothetical protein
LAIIKPAVSIRTYFNRLTFFESVQVIKIAVVVRLHLLLWLSEGVGELVRVLRVSVVVVGRVGALSVVLVAVVARVAVVYRL